MNLSISISRYIVPFKDYLYNVKNIFKTHQIPKKMEKELKNELFSLDKIIHKLEANIDSNEEDFFSFPILYDWSETFAVLIYLLSKMDEKYETYINGNVLLTNIIKSNIIDFLNNYSYFILNEENREIRLQFIMNTGTDTYWSKSEYTINFYLEYFLRPLHRYLSPLIEKFEKLLFNETRSDDKSFLSIISDNLLMRVDFSKRYDNCVNIISDLFKVNEDKLANVLSMSSLNINEPQEIISFLELLFKVEFVFYNASEYKDQFSNNSNNIEGINIETINNKVRQRVLNEIENIKKIAIRKHKINSITRDLRYPEKYRNELLSKISVTNKTNNKIGLSRESNQDPFLKIKENNIKDAFDNKKYPRMEIFHSLDPIITTSTNFLSLNHFRNSPDTWRPIQKFLYDRIEKEGTQFWIPVFVLGNDDYYLFNDPKLNNICQLPSFSLIKRFLNPAHFVKIKNKFSQTQIENVSHLEFEFGLGNNIWINWIDIKNNWPEMKKKIMQKVENYYLKDQFKINNNIYFMPTIPVQTEEIDDETFEIYTHIFLNLFAEELNRNKKYNQLNDILNNVNQI